MDRLPVQLSQASGIPFYRQVVDQVAQLVRSGQLAPGARLPSVRELSAQLLVSLITVRRSYSDLEAAGLIVRKQGQGTFVAETVKATSRRLALKEARNQLAEAVARARRLGLRGAELRAWVEDLLTGADGTGDAEGAEGAEGDSDDSE
jgi:GntR family transcriptional regulator